MDTRRVLRLPWMSLACLCVTANAVASGRGYGVKHAHPNTMPLQGVHSVRLGTLTIQHARNAPRSVAQVPLLRLTLTERAVSVIVSAIAHSVWMGSGVTDVRLGTSRTLNADLAPLRSRATSPPPSRSRPTQQRDSVSAVVPQVILERSAIVARVDIIHTQLAYHAI